MNERTSLGEAILKHWRENCPQMVRDLEKENRLEQAVFAAQEKTGDLLYELGVGVVQVPSARCAGLHFRPGGGPVAGFDGGGGSRQGGGGDGGRGRH